MSGEIRTSPSGPGAFRIVASGKSTIPANAGLLIGPVVKRKPGETFSVYTFPLTVPPPLGDYALLGTTAKRSTSDKDTEISVLFLIAGSSPPFDIEFEWKVLALE